MFSIRVAATDNLKRLADHFGTQWARDYILPKVIVMLLLISCGCANVVAVAFLYADTINVQGCSLLLETPADVGYGNVLSVGQAQGEQSLLLLVLFCQC